MIMEYLANSNQRCSAEERGRSGSNANDVETRPQPTLCKRECCGCVNATSLKCMGICLSGTLLLIIGTVLIALYFTSTDNRTYLIPALVLFILGIIFISIAEWVCRVKIYHRYGRSHQRALERLSGIERRLNSGTRTNNETDQPPPYDANGIFTIDVPSTNRQSATGSGSNISVARLAPTEQSSEDAPSYSITISDEVLPTYQEATSSGFELVSIKKDSNKIEM